MSYARDHYGDRASPNICPDLIAGLCHHLRQHKITPDTLLIERILFRRGIIDQGDMQRSYGEGPMQKFRTEYRTEVCKAI
jgi:hypothetical protein